MYERILYLNFRIIKSKNLYLNEILRKLKQDQTNMKRARNIEEKFKSESFAEYISENLCTLE